MTKFAAGCLLRGPQSPPLYQPWPQPQLDSAIIISACCVQLRRTVLPGIIVLPVMAMLHSALLLSYAVDQGSRYPHPGSLKDSRLVVGGDRPSPWVTADELQPCNAGSHLPPHQYVD